jgi:uncharacterized LabA/DUF88 family protein
MVTTATAPVGRGTNTRVRVFVDYWNFQLSLNEREASSRKLDDYRFEIGWQALGPWLAGKACAAVAITSHSFDGLNIYTSHDPKTPGGLKFHKWATGWLNRQPGVNVSCQERKPKSFPRCPTCHREIQYCPHSDCGKKIVSTIEKGVDTLIATDMIRLAWEDAYDLAVLATSDRDLIPAVEFLSLKGRKVVQAGFPPQGLDLASKCWASFDVYKDRAEIKRP